MNRGPVETVLITFPADQDVAAVADSLREPVESGTVRIIDLVLFERQSDGTVTTIDAEDDSAALEALAPIATDPRRLLNDEDLEMLSDSVPDGRSGVAVVFEHVWATSMATKLTQQSAELTLYVRIPAADVEAAFAQDEGNEQ